MEMVVYGPFTTSILTYFCCMKNRAPVHHVHHVGSHLMATTASVYTICSTDAKQLVVLKLSENESCLDNLGQELLLPL